MTDHSDCIDPDCQTCWPAGSNDPKPRAPAGCSADRGSGCYAIHGPHRACTCTCHEPRESLQPKPHASAGANPDRQQQFALREMELRVFIRDFVPVEHKARAFELLQALVDTHDDERWTDDPWTE